MKHWLIALTILFSGLALYSCNNISGLPGAADPSIVGPSGGTVTLLKFGVFGDSRPDTVNCDISQAPCNAGTAIVTSIIKGMAQKNVQFILAGGDYIYCNADANCAASHAKAFLGAEVAGGFQGTIFHAMGNHECITGTCANCPNENETPNVQQYMQNILAFEPHSYFDFSVQTSQGLAHFIVSSPNAWDSSNVQQNWLNQVAAQPADYTFYLQHEPRGDEGAPCPAPGAKASYETMRSKNPNTTLYLYSHVHEYMHYTDNPNEVIVGNGGAPLNTAGPASGQFFGYLIVEQLANGNVQVTAYEAVTDIQKDQWTVTPKGQLVQ